MEKSKSVILSDISRSLEEPIPHFTQRLSRQVSDAIDLQQVQKKISHDQNNITDETLVIVDESDITKPYAEKMEALGYVHDGSVTKLKKDTLQLIFQLPQRKKASDSYYHSVCSAKSEGFESMNVEVDKGFNHVNRLFKEKPYTLVMDRGYDSNKTYEYIQNQGHQLITRLNDRRYLIHKNKRIKVPQCVAYPKGIHYTLVNRRAVSCSKAGIWTRKKPNDVHEFFTNFISHNERLDWLLFYGD